MKERQRKATQSTASKRVDARSRGVAFDFSADATKEFGPRALARHVYLHPRLNSAHADAQASGITVSARSIAARASYV